MRNALTAVLVIVALAGPAVGFSMRPIRTIAGDLDLDDTDPLDVICTFDPTDDFYPTDPITCTVAAGLADTKGNEMEEDFVWSFDMSAVEESTWGEVKAGFE